MKAKIGKVRGREESVVVAAVVHMLERGDGRLRFALDAADPERVEVAGGVPGQSWWSVVLSARAARGIYSVALRSGFRPPDVRSAA